LPELANLAVTPDSAGGSEADPDLVPDTVDPEIHVIH
jgi:hypothetical protein